MPNADLILPGFYGKLPSAGDFVTRRLPHDFVQVWDRWLARHVVPLIGTTLWEESTPLRFISGPKSFGPAAGIVVASHDRVGRRFPLSIVALLPAASAAFVGHADHWFAALESLAADAHEGLSSDELDSRLSALHIALDSHDESEPVEDMVVWTGSSDLYDIDPAAPEPILRQLLTKSLETS